MPCVSETETQDIELFDFFIFSVASHFLVKHSPSQVMWNLKKCRQSSLPYILAWTHWMKSSSVPGSTVSKQRWSKDIEEEVSLPIHTQGFSSSLQRLTGLAVLCQLAWLPFPPGILSCLPAIFTQKVANECTPLWSFEWWKISIRIYLLMSTVMRLISLFPSKHERLLEECG